ncbi:MAG: trypsin-like peptidase domain-containing protein [Elusimicrobia bacterium]|nr:trypsin-like peptidase domain-containing protein [Elusimicrobiota bacterium]
MRTSIAVLLAVWLIPGPAYSQAWEAGINQAILNFRNDRSNFLRSHVIRAHHDNPAIHAEDDAVAHLVEVSLPGVVMLAVQAKPQPQAPAQPGQAPKPDDGKPRFSVGSGFIVALDQGKPLIVTNAHVVKDAGAGGTAILQFDGGVRSTGVVLDYNISYDLALVRSNTECPSCAVLKFGLAKAKQNGQDIDVPNVKVGHRVIAIGAPFGLPQTVTRGIVSALKRNPGQGLVDDFIQTDASINHGNSGGPLFNMRGEVVGVNSMIFSPTGGSVGIGFAIPITQVQKMIDRWRATGVVSSSRIGAEVQAGRGGLEVGDITKDSPAEKAGLRKGDVIVKINGQSVPTTPYLFTKTIADMVPNTKVELRIRRALGEVTITVVLEAVR